MEQLFADNRIFRLPIPFHDIYTTVYLVKTKNGALLFDTGTYDSDAKAHILPFLKKAGVSSQDLKYIFVSHSHPDHAGGLKALMQDFPSTVIVSRSQRVINDFSAYQTIFPEEGDILLDGLQVARLPGHSLDACGILDTLSNTLISGDALQLYGIYGSGVWGTSVMFPNEYLQTLKKVESMAIDCLLLSHSFHPLGYECIGKNESLEAIRCCREALREIVKVIEDNKTLTDKEITALCNCRGLPTLHVRVVTRARESLGDCSQK